MLIDAVLKVRQNWRRFENFIEVGVFYTADIKKTEGNFVIFAFRRALICLIEKLGNDKKDCKNSFYWLWAQRMDNQDIQIVFNTIFYLQFYSLGC